MKILSGSVVSDSGSDVRRRLGGGGGGPLLVAFGNLRSVASALAVCLPPSLRGRLVGSKLKETAGVVVVRSAGPGEGPAMV